MNLDFLMSKVSLTVGKATLQLSKQSPHLLFGAGIVGFGATIYMSSKAVLNLDSEIDKIKSNFDDVRSLKRLHNEATEAGHGYPKGHEEYYGEAQYRKDLTYISLDAVRKVAKLYAPTVIVGVATVACLTKSHSILSSRNTALMAAYSTLEKSYDLYRRRVISEYGEEKDREFRYPVETISVSEPNSNDYGIELTDSEMTKLRIKNLSSYARFFDELSSSWCRQPEYNLVFLRAQQNWANDKLRVRGHVFLNEVYDSLGIPRSRAGSVVGWRLSKEGDNFIDFGIFDGSNPAARDFVNGREGAILLDFNVDGVIYDKIDEE